MFMISFRERVVLRGYHWWRRWRRREMVGFPEALQETDRLFICLPADHDQAKNAALIIPQLIDCLKARSITIACTTDSMDFCSEFGSTVRVVDIRADNRRWSGLANSALVEKIRSEGPNVAIDLNPRLDVMCAVLCLQSGAELRLSFQGNERATFFNVQIAVPPESQDLSSEPIAAKLTPYERFLNTVRGMMGQSSDTDPTKLK
ncbi:MAG: hypothetical protein HOH43_01430 [Candidatus Latescibacteria bacterium]|nr:hypothetical protein [Candidatus Latescibacterota bacterium]